METIEILKKTYDDLEKKHGKDKPVAQPDDLCFTSPPPPPPSPPPPSAPELHFYALFRDTPHDLSFVGQDQ